MSTFSSSRPPAQLLREWWPSGLLAAAILLPPGLNLVQYWLHNPLYGYGLWVPFLAGILFWRRASGADQPHKGWLSAGLITGYFAMLPFLRTIQIANPDWRLIDWLLAGGAVVALLALAFRMGGPAMLSRCWFPICFLLTAVPWSTSAEHAFTAHAVPAAAKMASEILWLGGIAAVDDGRTLHTAVGPIGVSEDCSGIRGFQLATMAALFWRGFLGMKNGRAAAMLVGGLALALLLNVLRVVAIVGAAVKTGQIATAERLHDPAGTAAQIALMLALPVLAWRLQRRAPQSACAAEENLARPDGGQTSMGLLPRAAIGAVLWCLASEVAAETWFRVHEAHSAPMTPRWTLNRAGSIMGAVESPIPDAVRENYRYSDAKVLDWKDAHGSMWRVFWLDFQKGALSACTYNIHRPDICLPSQDFRLTGTYPDLPVDVSGTRVEFHHQLFQRSAKALHLFSVTAQDTGALGQQTLTDWTLAGRLRAALLGLRSQRSQIVHLVMSDGSAPVAEVRQRATGYLNQILTLDERKDR